jgi:hypothetical protein
MARRLLISLAIGGLVLVAAYMIVVVYAEGVFVRWQPLGAPPDGAGELVQVSLEQPNPAETSVFLAAADGAFWRGTPSLCTANSATCWETVAELPGNSDSVEVTIAPDCRSDLGYRLGSPPQAVLSCASYSQMMIGTHFLFESHVARVADGSYWVWNFMPGQMGLLILMMGIVLAAVVALIAFIILQLRG